MILSQLTALRCKELAQHLQIALLVTISIKRLSKRRKAEPGDFGSDGSTSLRALASSVAEASSLPLWKIVAAAAIPASTCSKAPARVV